MKIHRAAPYLAGAFLIATLPLAVSYGQAPTPTPAAGAATGSVRERPVSGTLSNGSSFRGTISIRTFAYDPRTGLHVSGTVTGTASSAGGGTTAVSQAFANTPALLTEMSLPSLRTTAPLATAANGQAAPSCDLVQLDVAPITVGTPLDLSQIAIDATSAGNGRLLSLLCAAGGLLDPAGKLTDPASFLPALTAQLTQINGLLGS